MIQICESDRSCIPIELLTQERFGLKVVIPDDECRDYGQDRTTTRYNLGIIGDLRLMAILRDILHLNGFLQMLPIILLCMRILRVIFLWQRK